MYIKIALSLLIATAALSSCGKKSASFSGTWKVTGMELTPDSLAKEGMFDQEAMKKVRFNFKEDSTITITDGGTNTTSNRYTIQKVSGETFMILKPAQPNPQIPAEAQEQRMRIVNHTSEKLDLEQKFDPYVFTMHLVPQK